MTRNVERNWNCYEYTSELKFELHNEEGLIDEVMETSLQHAIDFFKDNYQGEGKLFIKWFNEKAHQVEIIL